MTKRKGTPRNKFNYRWFIILSSLLTLLGLAVLLRLAMRPTATPIPTVMLLPSFTPDTGVLQPTQRSTPEIVSNEVVSISMNAIPGVTSVEAITADIIHVRVQPGYINPDTANAVRISLGMEGTLMIQLDDGSERVRFYYRNGAWQRVDSQPLSSPTPAPQSFDMPRRFYTAVRADGRRCPQLSCDVRTYIPPGVELWIVSETVGDEIDGNAIWRLAIYTEREIYVHSSQLAENPPLASPTPSPPPRPTARPQSNTSSFSCPSSCAEAVARGVSARRAAACGLDRDHDGVACYGD